MDELDKLKSHWKNSEENFPQVTETEIYGMLHKRSSSAVKWILIISILEFVFWGGCSLSSFFMDTPREEMPVILQILDYVTYVVLIIFIVFFYINYKKVSVEKPVKELLDNIIYTRRIVMVYIGYVIGVISFTLVYTLYQEISKSGQEEAIFSYVSIGVALAMMGILVLLYNALYGRLVRKLNKNYRELQKMTNQ
jgi:hypothetical protein